MGESLNYGRKNSLMDSRLATWVDLTQSTGAKNSWAIWILSRNHIRFSDQIGAKLTSTTSEPASKCIHRAIKYAPPKPNRKPTMGAGVKPLVWRAKSLVWGTYPEKNFGGLCISEVSIDFVCIFMQFSVFTTGMDSFEGWIWKPPNTLIPGLRSRHEGPDVENMYHSKDQSGL